MSRSNPHVNEPNPAVRWFEWNGEHGRVRYYDKDTKQNVDVPLPFSFLLLDELATVRGWHDPSQSGIYSNEVRDTRGDVLVVKAFKGGTLAEGFYKAIKDRIHAAGAHFVANCYIGFKHNGSLSIGSIRFKGAALSEWMEFRKTHRSDLYSVAIEITGFTEGKKGRIVFRVPTFKTRDVSPETNTVALALDEQLQAYLAAYFNRRTNDQTESQQADDEDTDQSEVEQAGYNAPLTDDDIPF